MNKKTKIVLDSDVIIHFVVGGYFSILPSIFPNYSFIILNYVYNEQRNETKKQIDNHINFIKNISLVDFKPSCDYLQEFAELKQRFGLGESASMIYCKENKDVIGSNNLNDILEYCKNNDITFLTTLDFIYFAYKNNVLSQKDCNDFIQLLISKGHKILNIKIENYYPLNIIF